MSRRRPAVVIGAVVAVLGAGLGAVAVATYQATGDQVYRGVAGLFLVDDPATEPLALPHRYGAGSLNLDSPRFSPIGLLGDTVLVNGTHDPYVEVTTTRVRLRVLNASNARTYNLGFTDDRPFSVIAGDAAGFLAQPTVGAPDDGRRVFEFNHASRINGRHHDPARIDFSVRPGQVERWELRNPSANQHVFHVHGVSFTVVEVDGRPPPAPLRGPKDSLLLARGTTAVIDVRAPPWADAEHPYMFHCHVLAHEDHGMMGQFTVTMA